MATAQPRTLAPESPDRSTLVIVAGVFEIVLGCLAALMAGMMAAVMVLAPKLQAQQGPAINASMTIQPLIIYLLVAVGFLWLGIGLVSARRWAWTLTVVLSWMWLVIGVVAFVFFMLFMVGRGWAAIAEQAKLSPEAMLPMRVLMSASVAFIYIVLPGVLLLLCHHESVRATCLRRDPKVRWTDRCPMPVLALSMLFALSFVSMFSAIAYRCVVPVFGVVLSGAAGAAVILLFEVVLAYLAWGTYRLQSTAWWATLLLGILNTVNMVVTFGRLDLMKLYEMMGMSADQLEMIRKMGVADLLSRWGPWMGLVGGVVWLAYLLYIRRYFVRGSEATTATA